MHDALAHIYAARFAWISTHAAQFAAEKDQVCVVCLGCVYICVCAVCVCVHAEKDQVCVVCVLCAHAFVHCIVYGGSSQLCSCVLWTV